MRQFGFAPRTAHHPVFAGFSFLNVKTTGREGSRAVCGDSACCGAIPLSRTKKRQVVRMNPLYWVLVILSAFVGWVLLAPSFRQIGEAVCRAIEQFIKAITNEEDEN